MKKGFISMAVVYSFLIVFLVIMLSLLTTYVNRNNYINRVVNETKEYLNEGY